MENTNEKKLKYYPRKRSEIAPSSSEFFNPQKNLEKTQEAQKELEAQNELMAAIEKNDFEKVKTALSKIKNVNFELKKYYSLLSPLDWALQICDATKPYTKQIITSLIEAGADCQTNSVARVLSCFLDDSAAPGKRDLLCFCVKNMSFDLYQKHEAVFGRNNSFVDKLFSQNSARDDFLDLMKGLWATGKIDPKKPVTCHGITKPPADIVDSLLIFSSNSKQIKKELTQLFTTSPAEEKEKDREEERSCVFM